MEKQQVYDPIQLDIIARADKQGDRPVEQVDIEVIIFQQVQRCLIATSNPDPAIFEKNVMSLKALMRQDRRALADKFLEEECITREEKWQYKYWCGVPLGSPNKPHKNRYGEVTSPVLAIDEYVDYTKLFEHLLSCLEDDEVIWRGFGINARLSETKPVEMPSDIMTGVREQLQQLCDENKLSYYDLTRALVPSKPPETPKIDDSEPYLPADEDAESEITEEESDEEEEDDKGWVSEDE